MTCIPIKNGFLCISRTDFNCPYCDTGYNDNDDKYYNRMYKNKKGYTTEKCSCGKKFGIAADYTGRTVSFKIVKD